MKYLLDVNVPEGIPAFQDDRFVRVKQLDPEWSDRQIWQYALENALVIVTKDADFFHWSMAVSPAPKVLHLKIGNMRLQAFSGWIETHWQQLETLMNEWQLVVAYQTRIETIR